MSSYIGPQRSNAEFREHLQGWLASNPDSVTITLRPALVAEIASFFLRDPEEFDEVLIARMYDLMRQGRNHMMGLTETYQIPQVCRDIYDEMVLRPPVTFLSAEIEHFADPTSDEEIQACRRCGEILMSYIGNPDYPKNERRWWRPGPVYVKGQGTSTESWGHASLCRSR